MATTALSVLFQRVLEALGAYYTSTTTGTGSTTTLVDTAIVEWGEDDDAFSGWYARMTSGDADGTHRRIKGGAGFDFSSTQLTFTNAFADNPNTGQTYILLPYDPDEVITAIGASLRFLYRRSLYLPIRDESLIVGNLLLNQGFETFTGGVFTSWDKVGSPTVTAETSIVFHGTNSAKNVAGGSDGDLRQLADVNVRDLRGKSVTFKMMVFAEGGADAELEIVSEMGSTEAVINTGTRHAGDGEWERLSATGTVAADAQRIIAICRSKATKTAYFDDGGDCGLFIDDHRVYKYTVPTTIVDGPHFVSQQRYADDVDGPYDPILPNGTPTTGRVLRLEGKGLLTRPTSFTSTTEIGPEHEELVVAQAIVEMGASHATRAPGAPEIDVVRWENRVREIVSLAGGRMPPMSAEHPKAWHLEKDSSNRYLMFDR